MEGNTKKRERKEKGMEGREERNKQNKYKMESCMREKEGKQKIDR